MRRFMNHTANQQGIASLLAVSLTSFLIVVIVLAASLLMIGELRQSTDAANSIRAFYTATNGSEKAIYNVKQALKCSTQEECADNLKNLNSAGCQQLATNDTCTHITTFSDSVESQRDTDDTVQYDLSNAVSVSNNYIDHIDLQWDGQDMDASQSFSAQPPPIMEVTITNYFPTQQTNIDTGHSGSLLLVPRCTNGCTGAPSYQTVYANDLNNGPFARNIAASARVECHTTASFQGYRCWVRLRNITDAGHPGYKTVLRLTPRGGPARYHLEVFDQLGAKGPIPLPNAQVDVTAKVGDSLRRLQLEIPIRSSAAPGLTNVLFGDDELCKNFSVLSDNGAYQEVRSNSSAICPIN